MDTLIWWKTQKVFQSLKLFGYATAYTITLSVSLKKKTMKKTEGKNYRTEYWKTAPTGMRATTFFVKAECANLSTEMMTQSCA